MSRVVVHLRNKKRPSLSFLSFSHHVHFFLFHPPLFFSILPESLYQFPPLVFYQSPSTFSVHRSSNTTNLIIRSKPTTHVPHIRTTKMPRQGIKSPSHPHGHTQDGQQKVDAQGPTTAAS